MSAYGPPMYNGMPMANPVSGYGSVQVVPAGPMGAYQAPLPPGAMRSREGNYEARGQEHKPGLVHTLKRLLRGKDGSISDMNHGQMGGEAQMVDEANMNARAQMMMGGDPRDMSAPASYQQYGGMQPGQPYGAKPAPGQAYGYQVMFRRQSLANANSGGTVASAFAKKLFGRNSNSVDPSQDPNRPPPQNPAMSQYYQAWQQQLSAYIASLPPEYAHQYAQYYSQYLPGSIADRSLGNQSPNSTALAGIQVAGAPPNPNQAGGPVYSPNSTALSGIQVSGSAPVAANNGLYKPPLQQYPSGSSVGNNAPLKGTDVNAVAGQMNNMSLSNVANPTGGASSNNNNNNSSNNAAGGSPAVPAHVREAQAAAAAARSSRPGQALNIFLPAFLKLDFRRDVRIHKKLAEGGGGKVYLAEMLNSDFVEDKKLGTRKCVYKLITRPVNPAERDQMTECFYQEVSLMYAFRNHPNCVRLLAWTDEPELGMLIKLYDMDLTHLVVKKKDPIPFWKLSLDIAAALRDLHKYNITHNDVKSSNVFVEIVPDSMDRSRKTVKAVLADFGLAYSWGSDGIKGRQKMFTFGLSLPYAGPELLTAQYVDSESRQKFARKDFTMRLDVYAYAIILWELLERQRAWYNCTSGEIEKNVLQGKRPPISPQKREFPIMPLMETCWSDNPLQRYSMEQIYQELQRLSQLPGVPEYT